MVHPGASYSTHDVHVGYRDALRVAGVTVHEYLLDARIEAWGQFLKYHHRKHRLGKVDDTEVMTRAGASILEQAVAHGVDWVLVVSGMYLREQVLWLLRRAGFRVAILFTESPYDDAAQAQYARYAQVCFTNERASVPFLRQFCAATGYLPHAYDPARHSVALGPPEGVRRHDVVFVGTGFPERRALLAGVDWGGIDLGLYGEWSRPGRLKRFVAGGITENADAANLYRAARIGLNLYRSTSGHAGGEAARHAESLNPRAVELAACGAFTLSEYRAEVPDVFGGAVPTFRTSAELGALVRRYLADGTARGALAAELPGKVAHLTFREGARRVVSTLRATEGERIELAAAD